MNNEQKSKYLKLDLVKFQTEMEILSSRREYFRNNLETVDNGMRDFINLNEIPALLKNEIFNKWIENSGETNKKIENKSEKNINGIKNVYEKDNAILNNTKTSTGKTKIKHKETQMKEKTIET